MMYRDFSGVTDNDTAVSYKIWSFERERERQRERDRDRDRERENIKGKIAPLQMFFNYISRRIYHRDIICIF